LYRYFVSQSSEFCRHNSLCCFSTSVYCCLFRNRLSPDTFGYTIVSVQLTCWWRHSQQSTVFLIPEMDNAQRKYCHDDIKLLSETFRFTLHLASTNSTKLETYFKKFPQIIQRIAFTTKFQTTEVRYLLLFCQATVRTRTEFTEQSP
jgi:hypothetical protein